MPHTPQEGGRAREASSSSSRRKMIRNLNAEEVMMSTGQSLGIFVSGQAGRAMSRPYSALFKTGGPPLELEPPSLHPLCVCLSKRCHINGR